MVLVPVAHRFENRSRYTVSEAKLQAAGMVLRSRWCILLLLDQTCRLQGVGFVVERDEAALA